MTDIILYWKKHVVYRIRISTSLCFQKCQFYGSPVYSSSLSILQEILVSVKLPEMPIAYPIAEKWLF